ncbi:hypothetical protein Y032_0474g2121 [Ancylostoma ceylanicum]|uniref:Uncharacterized protein n=1 Tax=Ancylostoma ceylanicum TaxID=53326 RepID=A0A016WYA8_9BILA|nr:hypothetical protein Y032_0474g2121 [Ancylostoma ceylanicum]
MHPRNPYSWMKVKRARNPYSWMLSEQDKRARNPYSWMAIEKVRIAVCLKEKLPIFSENLQYWPKRNHLLNICS